jgi:hypothetical protein
MQQSNIELLARRAENPDAVDIEHTEGQDKVIMMVRGLVPGAYPASTVMLSR